jgi:hypothetical protein
MPQAYGLAPGASNAANASAVLFGQDLGVE